MRCHDNTRARLTHARLCVCRCYLCLEVTQLTLNCEKKFPFDSDVESLRTDAFDDHDNVQIYLEFDSHLSILRRIIVRKRNDLTWKKVIASAHVNISSTDVRENMTLLKRIDFDDFFRSCSLFSSVGSRWDNYSPTTIESVEAIIVSQRRQTFTGPLVSLFFFVFFVSPISWSHVTGPVASPLADVRLEHEPSLSSCCSCETRRLFTCSSSPSSILARNRTRPRRRRTRPGIQTDSTRQRKWSREHSTLVQRFAVANRSNHGREKFRKSRSGRVRERDGWSFCLP